MLVVFLLLAIFVSLALDTYHEDISARIDARREKTIPGLAEGLNKLKGDLGRNPTQKEGLTLLSHRTVPASTRGWRGGYIDFSVMSTGDDYYSAGYMTGLNFIYYAGGEGVSFIADKGKNAQWDVEEKDGFPLYNNPFISRGGDDILIREVNGIWTRVP